MEDNNKDYPTETHEQPDVEEDVNQELPWAVGTHVYHGPHFPIEQSMEGMHSKMGNHYDPRIVTNLLDDVSRPANPFSVINVTYHPEDLGVVADVRPLIPWSEMNNHLQHDVLSKMHMAIDFLTSFDGYHEKPGSERDGKDVIIWVCTGFGDELPDLMRMFPDHRWVILCDDLAMREKNLRHFSKTCNEVRTMGVLLPGIVGPDLESSRLIQNALFDGYRVSMFFDDSILNSKHFYDIKSDTTIDGHIHDYWERVHRQMETLWSIGKNIRYCWAHDVNLFPYKQQMSNFLLRVPPYACYCTKTVWFWGETSELGHRPYEVTRSDMEIWWRYVMQISRNRSYHNVFAGDDRAFCDCFDCSTAVYILNKYIMSRVGCESIRGPRLTVEFPSNLPEKDHERRTMIIKISQALFLTAANQEAVYGIRRRHVYDYQSDLRQQSLAEIALSKEQSPHQRGQVNYENRPGKGTQVDSIMRLFEDL